MSLGVYLPPHVPSLTRRSRPLGAINRSNLIVRPPWFDPAHAGSSPPSIRLTDSRHFPALFPSTPADSKPLLSSSSGHIYLHLFLLLLLPGLLLTPSELSNWALSGGDVEGGLTCMIMTRLVFAPDPPWLRPHSPPVINFVWKGTHPLGLPAFIVLTPMDYRSPSGLTSHGCSKANVTSQTKMPHCRPVPLPYPLSLSLQCRSNI